jgi:hypothetical protein
MDGCNIVHKDDTYITDCSGPYVHIYKANHTYVLGSHN